MLLTKILIVAVIIGLVIVPILEGIATDPEEVEREKQKRHEYLVWSGEQLKTRYIKKD